jgi:hypothetical protein
VTRKPAVEQPAGVCLYPETCALCKWQRPGEHQDPLTTTEWVIVFREPAETAA